MPTYNQHKLVKQAKIQQLPTFNLQNHHDAEEIRQALESIKTDVSVLGNSTFTRKLFEELFGKQLNYARPENGGLYYLEQKTNAAYYAFMSAVTEMRSSIQRGIGRLNKASVRGPFIIGMQVDDQTVQFGYRPYKHTNLTKAIAEAEKLRDRNNRSYSVFGVLENVVFKKGNEVVLNAPVEGTKQGVNGKLVPSPFRVMEELANIIKEVNAFALGSKIPVGISVTVGGKFQVVCPNSDYSADYDTYAECVKHIADWIKEYKQSQPSVITEEPEVKLEKPTPPPLRVVSEDYHIPKTVTE